MKPRWIVSIAGVVITIGAVFFFYLIQAPKQTVSVAADPFTEKAFSVKRSWSVESETRILIVPHHLVAAKEIASLISSTPRPSVVYLIAPDHFSQGRTSFTAKGSANFVERLPQEVARLRIDERPFIKEHGVYNLLPYMQKAWGNVFVVSIIVRVDASEQDRTQLADSITQRLKDDPHALLVASLDFSHYLPADVADFHDMLAEDVLRSLSDDQADRVEIDSPGALAVALRVARSLGLGDVTIHAHTNSLRILNATLTYQSTSHFLASFSRGSIATRKWHTVLETHERGIKSQENRLYWGQDEVRDSTSTKEMVGLVYEGDQIIKRFVFPYVSDNGEPELVIAGKPVSLLE